MKIKALAAAQNRWQNLLRLGRGEDEFHVWRRFLERLQESIEGRCAEHVHFVDDVDLEMPFARGVTHIVAQLSHLFDAIITRAVDLQNIETIPRRDFL